MDFTTVKQKHSINTLHTLQCGWSRVKYSLKLQSKNTPREEKANCQNKPRNAAATQRNSVIFMFPEGSKKENQLSWIGFSFVLSYLHNKETSHLHIFMFGSTDGFFKVKKYPWCAISHQSFLFLLFLLFLFFHKPPPSWLLPHSGIYSICYFQVIIWIKLKFYHYNTVRQNQAAYIM